MREQWVQKCLEYSSQPADCWASNRKILRRRSFSIDLWSGGLTMSDAGYTGAKMKSLIRGYVHEESRDTAIKLWNKRVSGNAYGSVGFTCYNHLMKAGEKRAPRATQMGPCLQSVILTHLTDHTTQIDIQYRTTELFKKFPADLVFLRDELLKPFDLETAPVTDVTFTFANLTCHPMYFVTFLPYVDDPVEEIDELRSSDPKFHRLVVKWTACYLCEEEYVRIAKYAQARRVYMNAQKTIRGRTLERLQRYLRRNKE